MAEKRISSVAALEFAWVAFRAHFGPLALLGGATLMLAMISQVLGRGGGITESVLGLIIQIFQLGLGLLLTRVALRLHDGESVDLSEPKPLLSGFLPFLVTSFLYGLLVTLGLVLLIIPGILLGLAFCFAPLFAAEGQRDTIEAFRDSARLTRGARGQLFGFAVMLVGLNLLGLMALVVGLVVTIPMSVLAAIHVFRRLQGRTESPPFVAEDHLKTV
jgi:hypothetical protein